MSDEPTASLQLTDGEKEQIKLTASYLNGIAIGLTLVGGLSIPASIALNGTAGGQKLLAAGISLISFALSAYVHGYAKRSLRRLDR